VCSPSLSRLCCCVSLSAFCLSCVPASACVPLHWVTDESPDSSLAFGGSWSLHLFVGLESI
jgi:hypothetical protein